MEEKVTIAGIEIPREDWEQTPMVSIQGISKTRLLAYRQTKSGFLL